MFTPEQLQSMANQDNRAIKDPESGLIYRPDTASGLPQLPPEQSTPTPPVQPSQPQLPNQAPAPTPSLPPSQSQGNLSTMPTFGSAQELAQYAMQNGITNLQNYSWWSQSPFKKDAWNIIQSQQGASGGTSSGGLPGGSAPAAGVGNSLPGGAVDQLTALKLVMRDMSALAGKQGVGTGLKNVFGQLGESGFAPEKVSGGLVNDIIGFVEGQVTNPIQSGFNKMTDILEGVAKQQEIDREERRYAREDAKSSLEMIYNQMSSGGLSFDQLTPDQKANIERLEQVAGLPKGFYQSLQSNKQDEVLSSSTRIDSNGNQIYDIVTRGRDGSLNVKSVTLGSTQGGKKEYGLQMIGDKPYVWDSESGTLRPASSAGSYAIPEKSKYGAEVAANGIRINVNSTADLDPNRRQCGAFVNDFLGLGTKRFGDTLASKKALINNFNEPVAGSAFVEDVGDNIGHVGIVETVNRDESGNIVSIGIADANYDKKGGFRRKTIAVNSTEYKKIIGYYTPKTTSASNDASSSDTVNNYAQMVLSGTSISSVPAEYRDAVTSKVVELRNSGNAGDVAAQYRNLPDSVKNDVQNYVNKFDSLQLVKDYLSVQNKQDSVNKIIELGVGGPGDLSLVYEFMKALDPSSVVRESEYASAADSGNIFLGALAKFNGMMKESGGILPENVKDSFRDIVNTKYDVYKKQYDNVYKEYVSKIDNITGIQGTGNMFITNYSGESSSNNSGLPVGLQYAQEAYNKATSLQQYIQGLQGGVVNPALDYLSSLGL